MAIDERSRHELHGRLDEVLGPDRADTLMHLPPVGWADVATKHDLCALEERIGLRLEATEQRLLATLRGEMISHTRTMVYANMAAVFSGVSLAFVAARLS